MNLSYFTLAHRHWRLLLLALLCGAGIGFAAARATPDEYTASTRNFVSIRAGATATDLAQSNTFAQARVKSYADVVTSRAVLVPVAQQTRYPGGASRLAKHVSATVPVDTVLVVIKARDRSSQRAALLANAVSGAFRRTVTTLELPEASGGSPVRVTTVEGALAPSAPSAPNTNAYVAIGAFLSLLLAWIGLLVRELVSTKLRNTNDVRAILDVPILGEIQQSRGREAPLPSDGHPNPTHAESFRHLRTNLQFAHIDDPARIIGVTSAATGEGKSTIACNLAASLAEANSKVVLVDGDLRRPTAHKYTGLSLGPGLMSVLTEQTSLDAALQRWGDSSLWVLSAGGAPPNPSELLGSDRMAGLLGELRERFDFVIVDAPPVLPVTDGVLIATKTDGTLLVCRRGVAKRHELERAAQSLAAVGAPVLGVAVNGLQGSRAGYGYYGAYGSEPSRTANPKN